jgi:hypothetical protein
MTALRDYPPVTCDRHTPPVFLVDEILDSGEIVQSCPACTPMVEVSCVRALYRSAMRGAVR